MQIHSTAGSMSTASMEIESTHARIACACNNGSSLVKKGVIMLNQESWCMLLWSRYKLSIALSISHVCIYVIYLCMYVWIYVFRHRVAFDCSLFIHAVSCTMYHVPCLTISRWKTVSKLMLAARIGVQNCLYVKIIRVSTLGGAHERLCVVLLFLWGSRCQPMLCLD